MSWQDRLAPTIQFTSPEGLIFIAGWRGDPTTIKKRVPLFNYPLVNGTTVQDLGVEGRLFPLTIMFEGEDHDKQSELFLKSWNETGVWQVIHPVLGLKQLQPIEAGPKHDPVGSGNITEIETQWIEPAKNSGTVSSFNNGSQINAAVQALNDISNTQLAGVSVLNAADQIAAFVNQAKQAIGTIKSQITQATDAVNQIQQQILNTLSLGTDLLSIGGQVQELLQSPGLIAGSIASQVSGFIKMGEAFLDDLPNTLTFGFLQINQTAVTEMFCSAVLGAIGEAVISQDISTRTEALTVMADIAGFFDTMTNKLDTVQTGTAGNEITAQYYSQSQSYAAAIELLKLTLNYLMYQLFSAKSARWITLDRMRAPFEIVVTELAPNASEVDAAFDFFLASNNLHGDDIIVLPSGRQVVLYA